jgi:hypothetical protein
LQSQGSIFDRDGLVAAQEESEESKDREEKGCHDSRLFVSIPCQVKLLRADRIMANHRLKIGRTSVRRILADANSGSAPSNSRGRKSGKLMLPPAEPNINPQLWKAIDETRLIRLFYKSRERIVEPHDYGIHNGIVKLLAYQVDGSSSHKLPDWRWMEEDLISDIQILNRTFPGGRPTPTGKHHKWDKLFIRVKPAEKARK